MDDGDALTAQDVAVYRAVLRARDASLAALVRTLDHDADGVDKAVARLVDLGLLRAEDDRLTAFSPMLAEASVLATEDLELDARRVAVERRRDAIRTLLPDWNSAFDGGDRERAVEVITDQSAVANVYVHYAQRCETEVLSVAPAWRAATRADAKARAAQLHAARRGVATRAVYQLASLRDRSTRGYLRELAAAGANVRLAPLVSGRGVVVDRGVALLPILLDGPDRALAVVRDPHVIDWLVATFEQLWAEAAPLVDVLGPQHEDGDELDVTRLTILALMAEGEKDEAISRRLSISVRTCRRHIADYMAQVGASSRFQAGVVAARSGHLDAPPSP